MFDNTTVLGIKLTKVLVWQAEARRSNGEFGDRNRCPGCGPEHETIAHLALEEHFGFTGRLVSDGPVVTLQGEGPTRTWELRTGTPLETRLGTALSNPIELRVDRDTVPVLALAFEPHRLCVTVEVGGAFFTACFLHDDAPVVRRTEDPDTALRVHREPLTGAEGR